MAREGERCETGLLTTIPSSSSTADQCLFGRLARFHLPPETPTPAIGLPFGTRQHRGLLSASTRAHAATVTTFTAYGPCGEDRGAGLRAINVSA
jgi:hypothetical protein